MKVLASVTVTILIVGLAQWFDMLKWIVINEDWLAIALLIVIYFPVIILLQMLLFSLFGLYQMVCQRKFITKYFAPIISTLVIAIFANEYFTLANKNTDEINLTVGRYEKYIKVNDYANAYKMLSGDAKNEIPLALLIASKTAETTLPRQLPCNSVFVELFPPFILNDGKYYTTYHYRLIRENGTWKINAFTCVYE